MKNKKKPLIIALCCLAALACVAAGVWFFWLKGHLAAQNADPAYVTSVSSITGMNTGAVPRYAGVVEPQKVTKVNKDDNKTVAQVLVSEGDEVHIGDPLFVYDTYEMQNSLKQAQIDLEGIGNQISTLQNQKSTLEKEQKKASKDEQYNYTVQIQSVELQIKTEEYNRTVKQGEIDKLNSSIANAQVLCEAEGVIQEINLTPKTDASGQALPFMSILSSGDFRIKGTVSELNINDIYEGQAVVVHSRVDPAQTWQGQIETIEREPTQDQNNGMMYYGVDSGEQSSKYTFYVLLSGLDGLILGQHVYIEPDGGDSQQKAGLWLPAPYVTHNEGGSFVWAQDAEERLELREVQLGEYDSDNDTYQIVEGLTPSDYIAYPSDSLVEGGPTTLDASQQFTEGPGDMDGGLDGGADIGLAPSDDTLLPEAGEEDSLPSGVEDALLPESGADSGLDDGMDIPEAAKDFMVDTF